MPQFRYMALCRNCVGPGLDQIMTGFVINTSNQRCEACGNVADAIAQARFNVPIAPGDLSQIVARKGDDE